MQALRTRQPAPQAAGQACARALVTPVLPQPPDLPRHSCPTPTAVQAGPRQTLDLGQWAHDLSPVRGEQGGGEEPQQRPVPKCREEGPPVPQGNWPSLGGGGPDAENKYPRAGRLRHDKMSSGATTSK